MVFHKNHWWLILNGHLKVFNPQPPKCHTPLVQIQGLIKDFWCLIPQGARQRQLVPSFPGVEDVDVLKRGHWAKVGYTPVN